MRNRNFYSRGSYSVTDRFDFIHRDADCADQKCGGRSRQVDAIDNAAYGCRDVKALIIIIFSGYGNGINLLEFLLSLNPVS